MKNTLRSGIAQLATLAVVMSIGLSLNSAHAATSCPEHYAGGVAPSFSPEFTQGLHELCNEQYAAWYSAKTRTSISSAEHLTPERVNAAHQMTRVDDFRIDPRIPVLEMSTLDDYLRSGFDRGHVAASGNMGTAKAQSESFYLSNMVPQVPKHNRGLWAGVEAATRDLTNKYKDVFVVTGSSYIASASGGVSFLEDSATRRARITWEKAGKNGPAPRPNPRVAIPTNIWKAVYVPNVGAAAYWTPNDDSGRIEVISINDLQKLSKEDVFPGIPQQFRSVAMPLPQPRKIGY